MPRQVKLFSWNINGVRSAIKKGSLQSFVAEHEPDILCLQEIRAHESEAEVDFPQYIEFWNTAAKKGYSGTAIFTRTDPVSVVNNLPEDIDKSFGLADDRFGDPNKEGRVLAAEYPEFWLVTAYSPNSKPDLSRLKMRCEEWDPAFLAYCTRLEESKPVVICGDLNVAHTEDDIAQPQNNKGSHGFTEEERASFSKMLDAGFVDTLRLFEKGNGHYSWWSNFSNARARNLGWRIDYFLVSESLRANVAKAAIHADVMGSDHCPVSLTLRFD
jgi:exodeoxyribonuclease-3